MAKKQQNKSKSLSEKILEDYYRVKRFFKFFSILTSAVIFIVAGVATYWYTARISRDKVVEIIMIPAIFSILTLIAGFLLEPRFLFIFFAFLGIIAGATVSWALSGAG